MALDQSSLSDLLDAVRAGGDLDFIREAMQLVLQALIELEATQAIGAARYERSDARTTHRNGNRARLLSTKAGDVELAIPKLREGSFYPSLLEPRRRIDRALWAVIMEAFVHGVSTRKVDDLVTALGIDAGVSKSQVTPDLRRARRRRGRVPRAAPGSHRVPLRVPRRHLREGPRGRPGGVQGGRRGHRGRRRRQPRGPRGRRRRQRGQGVLDRLPAPAAGPRTGRGAAGHLRRPRGAAPRHRRVMLGAAWQRCRVHFLRNVLAKVPRGSAEMVAAAVRTIFAQPDAAAVADQLDGIATKLGRQFPAVEAMLRDAAVDICAFTAFPQAHWQQDLDAPTPSNG